MKKVIISMVSAALMLAAASSQAAPAPSKSLKIGVLDIRTIVQTSPEVKKINEDLQKQFKPRQAKIETAQKMLQADIAKYNRNKAVMSVAQRNSLQKRIVTERQDLERLEQNYSQDLSLAQSQAMQSFFSKVKNIVDSLAAKNNYDLILQKNAVPYASKRVEITDQVLKALP